MTYHINKLLAAVAAPPIAEAHGWIKGRQFPADKPLIDVAQAVPGYPPPAELTDHLARIVGEPSSARYTDIEGMPPLRQALAADMGAFYGASIQAADTLIAAGCNQAFCLAVMALAGPGDEILLPLPYYFNHQMWLDMQGLRAVHLPFRPERGGVPDPADAETLIGPRTRAIVLVTPNNPTGAIYPPAAIRAFYDLAKRRGLALILDETYRDFLPQDGAPHGLFAEPDWRDTLVQLYSFSKVYCLTGYRVGSIIAGPALIAEIAKAMDTVAICAPRIGQLAALYGLEHLKPWRVGNTAMMRERLQALVKALQANDIGYELISAGAYFAYLRHPVKGRPAEEVARGLAAQQNILALPGSMFGPGQEEFLRFAFANVPAETMPAIGRRLAPERIMKRLTIRVGGLHTIDADLPAFKPTHVIGILDPTMPEPGGYRHLGPETDRILLRYIDREVEREHSPLPEHVETKLAAIERAIAALDRAPVRLFVHCHAGASRSTATAYLALVRQYGPAEAEAAFAELLRITNKPWPNRRVIEFGDALMGGQGRLLKPLDAYREANANRLPAMLRVHRIRALRDPGYAERMGMKKSWTVAERTKSKE